MEIAKLYITLAADATQYTGQLAQVDRDTQSWASGMADRITRSLSVAIVAALAAITVAIGGFFVSAVDKAADLEAQMDTVAALLGATAEQAELLRQATIDLALDPQLKVSATEAAQAIEMLAQNGLTVEEILGGAARATVELANATGADFTTAARIATDAMALWGMEASELGQVADGVTAVLVQSKFEVNDYALALAQAGGVAAAVGVSFQDFNATLVAIAPYFASGSDAGTSFKTMLQRLIPSTNTAGDAMRALGLITEEGANAFFNADGSMKDMAEVAGILHGALSGLSEQQRLQALSTIFGTDAMRAAAAMSQFTEEQFRNLMAVMANTSAAEIAAQRMENFSGAMDILRGVVEGLQLMLGNVLLPILTQLALAGANLLAEWGPPLIAGFERLTQIFGEFFANIESGMSVWGALQSALMDIGQLFGMTADEAIAFSSSVREVVEAIVNFVTPIAQAITSFVSWKDALLAAAVVITGLVLPAVLSFLAPIAVLAAAIAGLMLVFAALRNAFETNFLGIRDVALGVWSALQQVFEGIKALLSGDTAGALAAFRAAWETGWNAIVGFVQNAGTLIGQALAGLWQSIVAWFQGIDWGALGQMLVERFLAGMAALGELAASRWEGLLTSLTNFIQSVDWAAVGYTLVDLLVRGILGAVGLIATAVAGIVTFIWNFITGTNWIELGINLVNAILDGLGSFVSGVGAKLAEWKQAIFDWAGVEDWSGVAGKIAEMVGNALGTAKEAISSKLSEWQTAIFDWAGAEDWQGVAEHIAEGVGEKLGEAKDAVTGQLSEWQTAIFDWADAEDWQGVAEHIGELIGEKLGEAGDAISSQLGEWQTAIFDWADAEDWQGVAEHIGELIGEKLGEVGDAISSQLGEWQTAIFDWADAEDWQGVAEHIGELIGEKLGEVGDAVTGQLSEWQTAIFDWADAEDWQGVAEHIAELVGEKLGEAKDSLTATLSEWQTAIFDWAETEDWSGVAQKIAEMVGDALGTAADSVISTLDSWEQAIFDWAGAADWAGVSETIAGAVGDSLVDVSDKVTEKLSGWITAFTNWVNTVDWYQVGYDIMFKITDAFLDFKEAITEKISTWLADTKTATEGYAWYEVGAYILLKIAESAAGVVADWVGTVEAWISNIGSAITTHLDNLMQVGRDIVGGIVAGIEAAANLIQGAIAGATAASVPAAAGAVGAQSPATKLMPVGRDISAGIAVGIIQGAGMIISAIGQVAGQVELEAVKAFSEAVKAIGEAIQSAVLAYVLLSGFGGADTGGAAAGLASIVLLMKGMVDAFVEANTHAAEALELVGKFADAAESLVSLIANSLLPLRILAAIDTSFLQSASLAEGLGAMRDFLAALVGAFVEAAAELGVLGSLVEAFTSAAEGVVNLVEDALRAAAMLSGFNFAAVVQGDHLASQIITFRNIVRTMVREFAEAALEFAFMSEAVQMFTEAAEGVIGLVEDGLRAAVLLSGFNFGAAVQGWHLREQIIIFRNIVQTMVREFIGAALEFGYMGEAVEAFTEAAEGVIGLVEEGLHAVMLLSGFNFGAAVQGWHLQQQIVIFRNIVRTMVREFAEAALEFGAMAESVSAFAEAAEGVIGLVGEGLAAATALSQIDFGAVVQGWHLRDQIVVFRNIIRTLIREFAEAAAEFGSMAESVEAFADAAEGVLDLVIDGIEAVRALSETDFGALVQGWHLATQIEIFRNIIRTLIREFAEAAAEFGSMAESVEAFADAAGAVVDLVEPAIEAVGLLANYSADTAGLSAALNKFITDLVALTVALAAGFQQISAQIGESIESAADFADNAAALIDVVEPGIEALAAIAQYEAVAGIRVAATAFAQQLVAILVEIANAFNSAATTAGGAVTQAADFAESAETILDVVEPGIEALAAIATYFPIAGIRTQALAFGQQLVAVLVELANAFVQAADNAGAAVAGAAEFAENAADVLDVVEPGIEALAGLASYVSTAGAGAAVQTFAADLVTVVLALVDAFQQAGLLANQAVIEAGEMSGALEDIVSVVEPAVEAVVALVGYTTVGGLKTNVQQFAADLVIVVQTLVDGLAQAGLLANQAVAEAGEMAGHIEDIISVVDPALNPQKGALPELAKYVSDGGLIQKTQQFTNDLIAVVQILVDGLTQSALGSGVALTKAGEMAKSLKDLFDAIGNSITAIEKITAYTSAAGLTQKAQQFTDDLVAVATVLVTGLTAAANQLGAEAVSAAHAFAQSVGLMVARIQGVVESLNTLGAIATPNIEPKLAYIVQSAQQITTAFTTAGDIGAAVQYAEAFRANLEQLVQEVQAAVAQLAALAGTGTTGSIGTALAAIANSLQNTEGQFAGAGQALANALIVALAGTISAGQGAVLQALAGVLAAANNAGLAAARGFNNVGLAVDEAIAAGVQAGQGQVIGAVVQVVAAAIAAGLSEARKAATIGQQLIQAVLAEVNAGRSALDSAGAAAGTALIDGMVRAIGAGKSRLVNAIKDAVQAAITAAQAALGIASPSRVAFALFDNFMKTAEIPLSDPRGLVRAIGRSTRAMVDEAARAVGDLAGLQMSVIMPPAPALAGAPTMRLPQPALATAGAAAGLMTRPSAQTTPVYNFYGDVVVEGVEDRQSFLEEIAAMTGARRR